MKSLEFASDPNRLAMSSMKIKALKELKQICPNLFSSVKFVQLEFILVDIILQNLILSWIIHPLKQSRIKLTIKL